jgi:hypothetical protein
VPKRVIYSTSPVLLSVVSYDLAAGEEPFLSYTWSRSEGPPLMRTGAGAPSMEMIDGNPEDVITHPVAMRRGSWLVHDHLRDAERAEVEKALKKTPAKSNDAKTLKRIDKELANIESHQSVFNSRMPRHEIVGMQGCGDLTMNAWNVAYASGALTPDNKPTIVALRNEEVHRRRYAVLVKWKREGRQRPRVSIEEVRFSKNADDPNNMVWVHFRDVWLPRASSIEFAVSNQQVIRNGEVLSAATTCYQFGDLRHLIQMPNLNPDAFLYPGDSGRPRHIFKADQDGDIWLGEEFLLNGRINVQRAALSGAITMEVPDCPDDLLRGALLRARYEEVESSTVPLTVGQWRFTDIMDKKNWIEIYFRRNTYSWSMLGLTQDRKKLLSLACRAEMPGQDGMTLEQAAAELRRAGVWNALLIDEGLDVFHEILEDDQWRDLVPLRRNRLRSVFIFARPKMVEGEGAAVS